MLPNREVPELDRRQARGFFLVMLLLATSFLAMAIIEADLRWVLLAIWPGAMGLFGTIAYKRHATYERVGRWFR